MLTPNHDQAVTMLPADRQHGHAALLDHAAPAGVQDQGVPDDDEQGAVFLGVPAPEAAPGLVGPDAAQHRADEAEQQWRSRRCRRSSRPSGLVDSSLSQRAGEHPSTMIDNAQEAGDEGRGIAEGDAGDVGGEPEIGVQHRLHHLQRVAGGRQVVGDQQRQAAGDRGDDSCPCRCGKSAPGPGPGSRSPSR